MIVKQVRLNLTQRQSSLLNQALASSIIANTSEGIRRAIDDFLDKLVRAGKLKAE